MACTRAIGIARPSSTSASLSRCGAGSCPAHAECPASIPGTVCTVKSPGETPSSSSQRTGNDTGTPGRTRGLYAAATVAPPALVESRKTFPSRSDRMNAVVASPGSSRSARAASALVAAAASAEVAPCDRHVHVHPL
jgi:hypothetical protein